MGMTPDVYNGIVQSAQALGMSPTDLGAIISYETAGTFSPTITGPTTQWGKMRGLLQFGEPQASQYGVDWNNPVQSQLGPQGAVVKYFQDNGWQPGMSLKDAYSIVNAGAPGRYNASDAGNGGAPGTVGEKVDTQFGPHIAAANALFGPQGARVEAQSPQMRTTTMASNAPSGLLGSPQAQQPSIWDMLSGKAPMDWKAVGDQTLGNPDFRHRMSIALAGMSTRPNQGLIAADQQALQDSSATKKANKTADWLRQMGRSDLADAVASGGLSGAQAAQVAVSDAQTAKASAQSSADTAASTQLRDTVLGGAPYVMKGDQQGLADYLAKTGLDKQGFTPDNFAVMAASVPGVADAVKGAAGMQPPTVSGPDWRPATPQEASQYGVAAGQINTKTGQFQPSPQQSGGIVFGPDGRVVSIGGPAAQSTTQQSLLGTPAMLRAIDGVLNDPDLEKSTGVFSYLQAVPGTPQYDFGQKAKQLQGQAFLQAFNSLRGGGSITETEGQKATDAIGRLSTAQSPGAYISALKELRDILASVQPQSTQGAPSEMAPQAGGLPSSSVQLPAPQVPGINSNQVLQFDAQGNLIK